MKSQLQFKKKKQHDNACSKHCLYFAVSYCFYNEFGGDVFNIISQTDIQKGGTIMEKERKIYSSSE